MNVTPAEVEIVLSSAPNLNAALKTMLKREGRPGNLVEPFVKSMRSVVARNRDGELLKHIETNFPTKPNHFLLLASYAFPTICNSIAEKVITQFAETFNATYQTNESGITVTNPEKFKSIIKAVVEIVKTELNAAQVPSNNFSVNAVLSTIFTPEVYSEAMLVLR